MAFNQEETAWIVEKMSEKGVGKGQPGQRPSGRVHRRAERALERKTHLCKDTFTLNRSCNSSLAGWRSNKKARA